MAPGQGSKEMMAGNGGGESGDLEKNGRQDALEPGYLQFDFRVVSYFVTRNRTSSSTSRMPFEIGVPIADSGAGPIVFVCKVQTSTDPARHPSLPLTLK